MSEKVRYDLILNDLFTARLRDAADAADDFDDEARRSFREVGRQATLAGNDVGRLENKIVGLGKGMMKRIGGLAAGFFAVSGIKQLGQAAMDTSAKYQTMQAVLENTFGDQARARDAFSSITAFASKTPFQVDELTNSFVKLTNQGFTPTMNEMTNLGDLASSTGKSFDQLTEAIIDAQTGEFERLKEFGIRASKEGDKVTFMFKGQATTVNFTGQAIREYMLSLGKLQGVQGAMNKISKTTGGQLSNLKDNWDQLLKVVGDRGKTVFDSAISGLSSIIAKTKEWVRVPAARTLEDERQRVNALAMELSNSLTPYERRKTILNELKEINSDIVKGLDAERISLGQLTSNIEDYNRKAIRRIAIETKKEELQALNEKASEATLKEAAAQQKMDAAFSRVTDKIRASNLPDSRKKELISAMYDPTIRESISGYVERNYEGGASSTMKTLSALQKSGYDAYMFEGELAGIKDARSSLNEARRAADAAEWSAEKFQKGINHMERMFGLTAGSGTGTGGTTPLDSGGTGTGTGGSIQSGIDSITGDVRAAKNIIINLDALIGENNNYFESAAEADVTSFKDKLKMTLQSVINDVNYAI
jgi:hypothetical protein